MPSSMALRVLSMIADWPPRRISPASGAIIPDKTLIMVDLPAPFWPTSAWISPRPSTKATPSSASTPGNCFVRLRTSSAGDAERGLPFTYSSPRCRSAAFRRETSGCRELVVGELERRHDIVLGDQDALDEKLLLIGLVGGNLKGQVGLPEARILRRQQDRAFQDAVAHRLETFLRAVDGHEHDLPLPTAARDDLRGGHGQAVAVAVDQIERGVGGHPVFSDRDRLGRIPVGGVLRDDLDAWISRHHVDR